MESKIMQRDHPDIIYILVSNTRLLCLACVLGNMYEMILDEEYILHITE